jgi:hypothetical protein
MQSHTSECAQGFFPVEFSSKLADKLGPTFKLLTASLLVVHVTSLVVFWTYITLGQREGIQVANTLKGQYADMVNTAKELHSETSLLQQVVNGTRPVSGDFINATFQPDPPVLQDYSQVRFTLLSAMKKLDSGVHPGRWGRQGDWLTVLPKNILDPLSGHSPALQARLARRCS